MANISFPALRHTRSMLLWVLVAISVLLLSRLLNPPPDVNQLTIAQAKTQIDAGAMVIDVRSPEAFDHRHLPGAINLPLAVLQVSLPALLSQAHDRTIVVYCNDGVRTGPEATQILNRAGFTHASNVQSGIEGWVAAGHPVTR